MHTSATHSPFFACAYAKSKNKAYLINRVKFVRSNTEIVGSNPTRGMDVCASGNVNLHINRK
jgi:hypothetical protein